MATALEGVGVLDFTRVLSGPYCTMMLGDMGADVIKIEEPTKGDEQRTLVVYRRPEDEDFFYPMNRNKRSVAVDLKAEEGKQIIYDLVRHVDVVVENFSPGVTERLGIDYPRLSELNPGIVYCSISGFGQTGPYRDRKAYDGIVQAMAGAMSVTGFEDGPPTRFALMVGDISSAFVAAFAILSAYVHRLRTGDGQYIDVSMLDSLISMWSTSAAQFLATGKVPVRHGNEMPQRCPCNCYATGDGRHLEIIANTPVLYPRLCEALGMPDLARDPRFDTMAKRIANRKELNAIIQDKLVEKPVDEWVEILAAAGVPSGKVNNLDEVFSDPHVLAREMLQFVEHPVSGPIRQIGLPYKLSGTPGAIRRHPPLLGQHTEEVLSTLLGYEAERIVQLVRKGVVRCPAAPLGPAGDS